MCVLDVFLLTLVFWQTAQLVHCSSGDRNPVFQNCLAQCQISGCVELGSSSANCQIACPALNQRPVPLSLRITQWSCADDCKYGCMRAVEAYQRSLGRPPEKYYGKWPFTRVVGLQELASVVFSGWNMAMHVWGLARYRSAIPRVASKVPKLYWQIWVWHVYAALSINSWWWSMIFHSRDTGITEVLDYFSAVALIAFSTYATLIRVWEVTPTVTTIILPIMLLARHYYYMLYIKFDYGYNMMVCIVLGAVQTLLWLTWAMWSRHPAKSQLVFFVFAVNLAMLLEVLDFPPYLGLFDAHSMWHLCTVPLVAVWYGFLAADAQWMLVK